MHTPRAISTVVGLALALGGPPVVAVLSDRLAPVPHDLMTAVTAQLALVAICATVLAILRRVEQQPFCSIGLRRPTLVSAWRGVALAAFFIFPYSTAASFLLQRLAVGGFEAGLANLAAYPVWYLVLAVLVAGVVEEILYRGYAIERLAFLTNSYWIGGAVSTIIFGCAHVWFWGWGASLAMTVAGAIATAFYIWTRDLGALILSHIATDFVGIVLMPALTPQFT